MGCRYLKVFGHGLAYLYRLFDGSNRLLAGDTSVLELTPGSGVMMNNRAVAKPFFMVGQFLSLTSELFS
jgi:hypothetical protein